MTRDDLAAIDTEQLPPWDCCHRRGPHDPECPYMDERFDTSDVSTPSAKAWIR